MAQRLMSTTELLDWVKAREGEVVEAALTLNFGLRATHFVDFWKGRFHDTGIDSSRCRVSRRGFEARYSGATWRVEV